MCADVVVGRSQGYSEAAWVQVYRALDHGTIKAACEQAKSLGFPTDVVGFATTFLRLRNERHKADYDPSQRFSRMDALDLSRTQRRLPMR